MTREHFNHSIYHALVCAMCECHFSSLLGSRRFSRFAADKKCHNVRKSQPGLDCRRRADATHQINHILELPFLSARLKIKRQEFDAHMR
jgi:hypothetical protein